MNAYFVCAMPRTGSSLLLGLLESTGVAGRPQAFFRAPDESAWAERWRIRPGPDGGIDYLAFLRAARVAGSTPNGVFGAKLMWGTLDEVIDRLAPLYPPGCIGGVVAVTRDVLGFLGLEPPGGREIVARHRRQADGLNARWIERLRSGPLFPGENHSP